MPSLVSTIQPRISLVVVQSPSPCSAFLRLTKSFVSAGREGKISLRARNVNSETHCYCVLRSTPVHRGVHGRPSARYTGGQDAATTRLRANVTGPQGNLPLPPSPQKQRTWSALRRHYKETATGRPPRRSWAGWWTPSRAPSDFPPSIRRSSEPSSTFLPRNVGSPRKS